MDENKKVKLKIDGREITARAESTILEASRENGIEIPTLCYEPRLKPYGACRICLVTTRDRRNVFMTACTIPVAEGMDILTRSEEIDRARKFQLQLLLLTHEMECQKCVRMGDCEFQSLIYTYGVTDEVWEGLKIMHPVDRESRLIFRNPNKCIMCGKCVRICDNLQRVGEINLLDRGVKVRVATGKDRKLGCYFCGECLAACPVGALESSAFDYTRRVWELDELEVLCPFCGCGCTFFAGIKNGRIMRTFSDLGRGSNHGNLCVRGRFGFDYHVSEQRLLHPMVRNQKGGFDAVSWEDAVKLVCRKLSALKNEHGGGAIAGIASSRLTNEELYLFQKLLRGALNSPHIDHDSEISHRGYTSGGVSASTVTFGDLERADLIFLIRSDPRESNALAKVKINLALSNNDARIITLGPVKTQYDSKAGVAMSSAKGAESLVINGLIRHILDKKLENRESVNSVKTGFDELKKALTGYSSELIGELSGVTRTQIEKAAEIVAGSLRVIFVLTSGVNDFSFDRELGAAVFNLALVTGNLVKAGSGILVLHETSNSQGAVDMGVVPELLPGQKKADDRKAAASFEEKWGMKIPGTIGKGTTGIYDNLISGKIKALYIAGANPMIDDPLTTLIADALDHTEFLVVQDSFLTDTAKKAHVILPSALPFEKSGTYTSSERLVQHLSQALAAPADVLTDGEILSRIGRGLGAPIDWQSAEKVFEEIKSVIPEYSEISPESLKHGGDFVKLPAGWMKRLKFEAPEQITAYKSQARSKDDIELFEVIFGPSFFQAGTFSRYSKTLSALEPEPYAEIALSAARRSGLSSGQKVELQSVDTGKTARIRIRFSRRVEGRILYIPYGFAEVRKALGDAGFVKIRKLEYVAV